MRAVIPTFLLFASVSTVSAQNLPQPPNVQADLAPPSIEPIAMTAVRFDPGQLSVQRVEGRWHLLAGKQVLKDFGPLEREASEALRLVRDLQFTQYGTIAGATPPFEFWLGEDGEGQKGGFVVRNVIPFNTRTLKVQQSLGAWVIRDDKLLLYNFGNNETAARQAFAIIQKHGFNQLGIIGIPRPVMTYLTVDPFARVGQAEAKVDPRETLSTLSQQGLLLPNVGYVGARSPIESRKLDLNKQQNEWTVVHEREVLGRFGLQETRARDAIRLLQDSRVTERVMVGKSQIPIYLSNGKAPRSMLLGFSTIRLNPAQMKVQTLSSGCHITEGVRTVLSFGDNRSDAELVLKVLQHFKFDQAIIVGDPDRGGLRLFSQSK